MQKYHTLIEHSKSYLVPLLLCSLFFVQLVFHFHTFFVEQAKAEAKDNFQTTTKFVSYDGAKYGITIQHPQNWKIKEDPTGVWFVSPVDETGNVGVANQTTENATLSKLVQIQLLQSRDSYKDFKISSSNLTSMAGLPANRTDYKFRVEVPKFLGSDIFDYTAFQVSAIKGDKMYTFTYFSTSENFHLFLPIAQKMLNTLRIL